MFVAGKHFLPKLAVEGNTCYRRQDRQKQTPFAVEDSKQCLIYLNPGQLSSDSVTRDVLLKGRLRTVDLLVLTSLDHLLLIMQALFTFLQNKLA